MGRTTRTVIMVAVALTGVGACSADGDESSDTADGATEEAAADAVTDAPGGDAAVGEGGAEVPAATTPGPATGAPTDVADTVEQTGSLAIEATATVAVADVTAAVDAISDAIGAAGGRITAADGDLRPASGDTPDTSTARLVLDVPPDQLGGVVDVVESLGTMTGYDQLAEDVAQQLTDLDVRIANERASIDRVRALIDEAGSLQDLVFLESELTSRETSLETLLATQRTLVDRVAMSTLTLELSTIQSDATPVIEAEPEERGLGDALGDGWDAFAGTVFAVVFVLALLAPFLGIAAVAGVVGLGVRRLVRRTPTMASATHDEPVASVVGVDAGDTD